MKTYNVYIYEQPFKYKVKAKTKAEADLLAVKIHNGGQWEEIYKTEVFKMFKIK